MLTGAITPGHSDTPIIKVQHGLWKCKNSSSNLLWLPSCRLGLCALEKAGHPAGKAAVWAPGLLVDPWGSRLCYHLGCLTKVSFETRGKLKFREKQCLGRGFWFHQAELFVLWGEETSLGTWSHSKQSLGKEMPVEHDEWNLNIGCSQDFTEVP